MSTNQYNIYNSIFKGSDESGESIKAKAFVVCDANQDGSLTWDEVEICEVNIFLSMK